MYIHIYLASSEIKKNPDFWSEFLHPPAGGIVFFIVFRIFEWGFLSSGLLVFHPDGKLLCNDQNNLCNFRFLDLLPRSGLSGVFVQKLQNHEVQRCFLQVILLLQSAKTNQQLSGKFVFWLDWLKDNPWYILNRFYRLILSLLLLENILFIKSAL